MSWGCGITVAEAYGGVDLGYLARTLLVMEQVSPRQRLGRPPYGAHSNLCISQIHRHGT